MQKQMYIEWGIANGADWESSSSQMSYDTQLEAEQNGRMMRLPYIFELQIPLEDNEPLKASLVKCLSDVEPIVKSHRSVCRTCGAKQDHESMQQFQSYKEEHEASQSGHFVDEYQFGLWGVPGWNRVIVTEVINENTCAILKPTTPGPLE